MTFRINKTETIYTGPIFTVDRLEVTLPNNRSRSYDRILIQNAVTILPVDDLGNVLFVQQYRVGSLSSMLELPAGKIENEEDALVTANREIREETGMASQKMQPVGKFFASPGYTSEYMHAFLATGLYDSPLSPDSDEFIHLVKIPLSKLLEMIQSGEIQDAKSLATFMLAQPYLQPLLRR